MSEADGILSNGVFSDLSEGQKALLSEFHGKIKGKNAAAALPVFASFAVKASKERPLTDAQKSAVMSAFYNGMPDKERAGYERLFKKLGLA